MNFLYKDFVCDSQLAFFYLLRLHTNREGKLYRTPQSMNALITFFALFGPAFYAPTFAQIGHEFGTVWFGIVYAIIVSLAITALYEAVKLMEDPFVSYITIDGIDVYEELSIVYYFQLLRARSTIFPHAPSFGSSPAAFGGSARGSSVSAKKRQSMRFSSSSLSTTALTASSRMRQEHMRKDVESGDTLKLSEEDEIEYINKTFGSNMVVE